MCDDQSAMDHEAVRERLKTIRALIKSARERIPALRPAWGAYLTAETLTRLNTAIDHLEAEIGMAAVKEGALREASPREGEERRDRP